MVTTQDQPLSGDQHRESAAEHRVPVEVVVEEFTESQRRGEQPSIDDYVAAHPDLADELREVLPAAAAIERLKSRKERAQGGRASLRGVQLERLNDFTIIREIGRCSATWRRRN